VKDLTIGQLASAAGVAASTVRFYEREKLLVPDARTGSNYRTYTQASLERLKFIRAAQASGFNLSDIREMLALTHSDDEPCREIATLIEHRLGDVRQRMKELKRVEKTLARALKDCCASGTDWCGEVDRLRKSPRAQPCNSPAADGKKKNRCTPLTLH
jgi:DNA-binding transcriptional MerR regulator